MDTLLTDDPPVHSRFRALVNKAFSARRVATLKPRIRQISNELIDRFIGDGKVELVSQFAVGLPMAVIADALGASLRHARLQAMVRRRGRSNRRNDRSRAPA